MVTALHPLLNLAVALLTLLVSVYLFRLAAGTLSLRFINLATWVFYYDLIFLGFIGITAGAMGAEHYMLARASDSAIQLAFYAVCYSMVVIPLAMVLIDRTFFNGRPKLALLAYLSAPLRYLHAQARNVEVLLWSALTVTATGATIYTYAVIGDVPFLALMGDTDESFLGLRQDAKFGFEGNVYVRNYLALMLAPIVSYIALGSFLARRNSVNLAWSIFSTVVALAAVSYSGEKAPLVILFLSYVFVLGYARGGFRGRDMVFAGSAGAVLIIALYLVTSGGIHIGLTTGPVGRLLFSQIAPLSLHFEYFPARMDFLDGASFPSWMVAGSGLEHLRSGRAVMTMFNPDAVAAGEAGVLNTHFMGEAWANFGWVGFLSAPWLVGTVIQLIHRTLLALPKSPLTLATMAYLTFHIPITGGFIDFIWNTGWLFLFILVIVAMAYGPIMVQAGRSLQPQERKP